MDSADAILEQLRRSQQRGLETMTSRLNSVLDRLGELVEETRASVQEALPKDAEELFPLTEAEAALSALDGRVEAADERARQVAARLEAGVPPAPAEELLSLDLLRSLDEARSQSDLLKQLLPILTKAAARAVVLVMRGSSIAAWSGVGYSSPDKLRGWQAEMSASPAFQRFANDPMPLRLKPADDAVLARWLEGEQQPLEAMLLPVGLRGKVMGAFYIDRLPGKPWNPQAAQALVAITCWLIDTLHYRQTVPSPMVAPAVDLLGEPSAEEEAEPEAVVVEPSAVEEEEPETAPAPEIEQEEPAEEAEFDPSATMRVDLAPGLVTAPAPAPPTPTPSPGPPAVQPVTPPAEPKPVQPVTPPAPAAPSLTPEEEARHEEARRFARLLVSEIKLYNEEEVDRGRANKDLYHRLKEDIDRSREMFEKRIPPEVRATRDYFHDELVRILADGDGDVLGM